MSMLLYSLHSHHLPMTTSTEPDERHHAQQLVAVFCACKKVDVHLLQSNMDSTEKLHLWCTAGCPVIIVSQMDKDRLKYIAMVANFLAVVITNINLNTSEVSLQFGCIGVSLNKELCLHCLGQRSPKSWLSGLKGAFSHRKTWMH